MPSYLVTGASRGLGLAFVAELLKDTNSTVIATARDSASSAGLQGLKRQYADESRIFLLDMDVMDEKSIEAAVDATSRLLPGGLDNLISNAGVFLNGLKTFEELDIEVFQQEVNFNITSNLLVMREFAPLVRKSQAKNILVITSGLGSIQKAFYMPNLANAYSVGKAALNMLVRKFSAVLKGDGITTALLHPGWVGSTVIGDGITSWIEKYAPGLPNLPVEKSAMDCMKVLKGLTPDDNGEFFNHDGTKLEW